MIGLEQVYLLAGVMFAGFAILSLKDRTDKRRWFNMMLWALIAVSFLFGDYIGGVANAFLAIAIVVVAASGRTGPAPDAAVDETTRIAGAKRFGNWLFLPALMVPFIALAGTIFFKLVPGIVVGSEATLVSLALGALLAALVCVVWFRAGAVAPFREGVRLMDGIGWAVLLPQMLAALGVVFALAGMGKVVGDLLGYVDTGGSLLAQVALYCCGMAAFTVLMGNAFAAFPVMFTAIGAPLLIHGHHGNPAAVAAIGMLAGFCGTLVTPMAANFNLVPAALLELKDSYGVIRAQLPTAALMLVANILLLYFLGFGH